MADQILEQARELFEGTIDFDGQKLAELLTTALLTTVGLVAFVIGYVKQDVYMSLYSGLAGTALTFLVVVPPWPFFNKNPIQWLPARNGVSDSSIVVDGKKIN